MASLLVATTFLPKTGAGQEPEEEMPHPVVIRTTLMPGIPDISHIPPGLTVAEPSIVADPNNPDRVAVGAMVEHRTRNSESGSEKHHRSHASTRVWYSTDGATTWSEGQDLLPEFSGIVADIRNPSEREVSDGDPVLTVLPDGRFSVAGIVAEWYDKTKVTRPNTGEGSYEGLIVATQPKPNAAFTQKTRIGLSDLPEPSYSYPHTPTLFSDRAESSPTNGRLYLTYLARMDEGEKHALFLKVSEDGGRTFSPPKVLPESRGQMPNSDALIGPDGTMHLLVTRDSTKAFYLTSRDGGQTFSRSTRIPTQTDTHSNWPHLATGTSGANRGVTFGVLGQRITGESRRRTDVKVFPISTNEGPGEPQRLDPDLSSSQQVRLPAPAVTDNALWVMAYRQDDAGTEVALYYSTDNGHSWPESRVIAT